MKKEEYPERIYCAATWEQRNGQGDITDCSGDFYCKTLHGVGFANVEYVRADLVPTWRNAQDEMPPIREEVLLMAKNGRIAVGELYADEEWASDDGYLDTCAIVAWCPILKRTNKEDKK